MGQKAKGMEHKDITEKIIGCAYKVIVELKSAGKQLAKAHEIQLVNYLVATGIQVGLLINFGVAKVEMKLKIRQLTNCGTVDLQDKKILSCLPSRSFLAKVGNPV